MIVLVVFFMVLVLVVLIVSSYGLPPKDKDVLIYLSKYEFKLNSINSDILSPIGNFRFISKPPLFGIIFPYYILDMGVIPFWYKSAKEIKKMYKELKK